MTRWVIGPGTDTKSSGVAQCPLFDSRRLRALKPTSWEARQAHIKHDMPTRYSPTELTMTKREPCFYGPTDAVLNSTSRTGASLQATRRELGPGIGIGIGIRIGVAGMRQSVVGRKGSWTFTHQQLIIFCVSAAERRDWAWLSIWWDRGNLECSAGTVELSECAPGVRSGSHIALPPSADYVTTARAHSRASLIAVARSG